MTCPDFDDLERRQAGTLSTDAGEALDRLHTAWIGNVVLNYVRPRDIDCREPDAAVAQKLGNSVDDLLF